MSILMPNGNEAVGNIPAVVGIKAPTQKILVELLTKEEQMNTTIFVLPDVDLQEAPQGYILDIGPGLDGETNGIKVGDRVVIQGNYVAMPNYDNAKRIRGIVELHSIKAVLCEAE